MGKVSVGDGRTIEEKGATIIRRLSLAHSLFLLMRRRRCDIDGGLYFGA